MGVAFSTPATMSDVIQVCDFPSGASMRLSTLGDITPNVSKVNGGYRLSDFAGSYPRIGTNVLAYREVDGGYIGFNLEGPHPMAVPTTSGSTTSSDSTDNLDIQFGTLRATVQFSENTNGVIFESGGATLGCALYMSASDKKLYWQCGDGTQAGGTMELSASVSGWSLGWHEVLVFADLRNNQAQGYMMIDGVTVDTQAPVSTGTQYNLAGNDQGGTGNKYDSLPTIRISSYAFTGTIETVRIYNVDNVPT